MCTRARARLWAFSRSLVEGSTAAASYSHDVRADTGYRGGVMKRRGRDDGRDDGRPYDDDPGDDRDGGSGDNGVGRRARPSRRAIAIGALIAVSALALTIGLLATRGDDTQRTAFSLADAARRAADAERVAYDVTVTVDNVIQVSAAALLDISTGSQQVSIDDPGTGGAASATPSSVASGANPSSVVGTSAEPVASTVPYASTLPYASTVPNFILDASRSPDGGITGGVVYVDSSVFAPIGLQLDVPWVRIDVDRLGGDAILDVRALTGRLGGNPLAVASLFADAGVDSTGDSTGDGSGSETVDGEELQHVRIDLPARSVLDANPGIGTLLNIDPATAPKTFTYDAFVTADNVLRRLDLAVTVGERRTSVSYTFRVFDGAAGIVVPDDNQSVDASEVFGS